MVSGAVRCAHSKQNKIGHTYKGDCKLAVISSSENWATNPRKDKSSSMACTRYAGFLVSILISDILVTGPREHIVDNPVRRYVHQGYQSQSRPGCRRHNSSHSYRRWLPQPSTAWGVSQKPRYFPVRVRMPLLYRCCHVSNHFVVITGSSTG